jgi:hypothetical protein
LNAAKSGDKDAALKSLCASDRALAGASGENPFSDGERVTSYSVGKVTQQDPTHATVSVTVSTKDEPDPDTDDLPVVKEGDEWKVCVTSTAFGGGTASSSPSSNRASSARSSLTASIPSVPTGLPTGLPSSNQTALAGLCKGQASGIVAASIYVSLAQSGSSTAAQGCVYKDTVPLSTTQRFSGKQFTPTGVGADGSITLSSSEGAKVVVKTSKQSDGFFYVTGVTFS